MEKKRIEIIDKLEEILKNSQECCYIALSWRSGRGIARVVFYDKPVWTIYYVRNWIISNSYNP